MNIWRTFLSLLLLTAVVRAQSAESRPACCTVQGQIVQQASGLPIKKVDVRLFGVGEYQESEDIKYTAVTDTGGRFKIEGVKPDRYRLIFQHAGFIDVEKRRHGSGMLLSLEPGQDLNNLLFHMAPGAIIMGKVTDVDGDPVPSVGVAAIPYPTTLRGPKGFGDRTNEVGEYRIGSLPSNRYLLMAEPLSQLRRAVESAKTVEKSTPVYGITYYPGTTEKSQAVPLAVHAGDETPANIPLRLVRFFHVCGLVTNLPAGMTSGAGVILHPLDEDSMAHIQTWPLDKDGGFEVRGVLPGSYAVLIVSGGYKDLRAMRGEPTVQVANGDVEGLRISAQPNGQIRGQLHMDNGQKTDWSQIEVQLYSKHRQDFAGSLSSSGNEFEALYWDDRPVRGEVKTNGSFEIKDIPADTYRLRIFPGKALQDYFVKSVNLGGKHVTDSGFGVGGTSYTLEIVVSANGAAIEGVALDEKDKPASDVRVICFPDASHRERHDLYRVVSTDYRGHFSLHGLNPGEYRVFTLDDDVDEAYDPEFVQVHESLGQTVKLDEGEHKSIVLRLAVSGD
ncbi:MAG: carboxypeptidase-like regulatory domain-containing protein [Terriglobales bacterium]|jgi:5-hydroxyisourate hydrolase-like protein (transthyretin family)